MSDRREEIDDPSLKCYIYNSKVALIPEVVEVDTGTSVTT
jgi:hypothetical protein